MNSCPKREAKHLSSKADLPKKDFFSFLQKPLKHFEAKILWERVQKLKSTDIRLLVV
jgi:hypothetical protein